MFKATIESLSHEGGLLAPFTGSSPALGSIIVKVDDGTYIGKIDAVLGGTDNPIAHIAHLDRKMNPDIFIGCDAQIRAKTPRGENRDRSDYQRSDRNDSRYRDNRGRNERTHRDNQRGSHWRDNRRPDSRNHRRDNRRENSGGGRRDNRNENFSRQRRDNFRRDSQFRDSNRRGSDGSRHGNNRDSRNREARNRNSPKKTFADNDWTCNNCGNVNFSFRTECNRCGEPKHGQSRTSKPPSRGGNGGRPKQNRSDDANRRFRRAKGKSANHAHNRGPQPLKARSRKRNRDD